MQAFTGSSLEKRLAAMESLTQYRRRFCYQQLEDYVFGGHDHRVMALYGLRRTGKTTMMYQAIRQIDDYDNVCLIQCLPGERMYDLTRVMDAHDDCKYYFIDEVTNLENFINTASVLSDAYAAFGRKVIMSGTDSLGFMLAKREQLFDRIYMLHTTYISFMEFNYLMNMGLDDYIQYGGTLTDGKTDYNAEYYSDYSNSAIVRNLTHTLQHAGRDGEYGELVSFFINKDVRTFINKILEVYNRSFLARTVNERFRSHDVGSLQDILERNRYDIDPAVFADEALRQEIMAALDIQEPLRSIATDAAIEEAKDWLERLDVIYRIPSTIDREHPEREEVIFTQPGLRYSQLEGLLDSVKAARAFDALAPAMREKICDILSSDIKGRMLEDIIYYHLAKDKNIPGQYEIGKFKNPSGEFDITLIDKQQNEAVIMEVKHSAQIAANQARFLRSREVCRAFEENKHVRIVAKAVIYMGASSKEQIEAVNYLNAEDFLKRPVECLQNLRQCCI